MNTHRLPVNVYGFRSRVLGISSERLASLAVFVTVSLVVFKLDIILSLVILLAGCGVTFYDWNGEFILARVGRRVLWAASRKTFTPEEEYSVEESSWLFVTEAKRSGLLLRIETDEIYDLGIQETASVLQLLNKALDTTKCDIHVFVIDSSERYEGGASVTEIEEAPDYATMKREAIRRLWNYEVYLTLSISSGDREADRKILMKDLDTFEYAIRKAGGRLVPKMKPEVAERICSMLL